MKPTVTAEADNVIGIVGGTVVLHFTLGDDADPPIHLENVTVTSTGTADLPGSRYSLQIGGNILHVTFLSLVSADAGLYTVTVETIAGSDSAETSLTVYGKRNGWC